MANTLQYSCLEKPPDRQALQAPDYRATKSWTQLKRPCAHRCKTSFAFGSCAPVRVEREGGTAAWLAGTLAAPSVQGHGLPLPQELWPYQGLFLRASCRWRSEGLFGRSFSVTLPIQALRGLPCLGSFSVSRRLRHIEGPTRLGPYSVVQLISHWKEHPVWGPTL